MFPGQPPLPPRVSTRCPLPRGLAWWSSDSGGLEAGIQLPQGSKGPDREEHSRLITLNEMQPRLGTSPYGCTTVRDAIHIVLVLGGPEGAGNMHMCMCPVTPAGSGRGVLGGHLSCSLQNTGLGIEPRQKPRRSTIEPASHLQQSPACWLSG